MTEIIVPPLWFITVHWVFAVMKSDIVTVTTRTEGTRDIASEPAVRRKSVTGRGDTERKKKGDTSHHGVVAGGGMIVRKVTVTGAISTRSPRGAKRARNPARSFPVNRRTRRPWSNSSVCCPSLILLELLVVS